MAWIPRPALTAVAAAAIMIIAGLPAAAAETTIAVAANFTEPAKEIARAFEARTGHKVTLSFGATGQFYTQITQDAPFTVLLSADSETPKRAVDEGYAVAGSNLPYAYGKLVLWSRAAGVVAGEDLLKSGAFDKLALANPKVAPYGAAAVEVLKRLGVYEALQAKLVQGANIAQTFQFVDTGNAELGFVALSQVIKRGEGSSWTVPTTMHSAIRQDVVLLNKGAADPAALAFVDFLKGSEAKVVIEKYGYATGAGS
jgi:molybdate transport system substrate-binding protein